MAVSAESVQSVICQCHQYHVSASKGISVPVFFSSRFFTESFKIKNLSTVSSSFFSCSMSSSEKKKLLGQKKGQ